MEPLYVYETTVEMSTLIFQQAKALDDIEDFEGALYLYQNALTVQESTLGMYHEDTLKTYWSLGWSCYQLYTRNQKAYKEKLRKLKLSATNDDDTETYDMLRTRMNQKTVMHTKSKPSFRISSEHGRYQDISTGMTIALQDLYWMT